MDKDELMKQENDRDNKQEIVIDEKRQEKSEGEDGKEQNELERFVEEHKEFFEKYARISEAVEEELEQLARYKAEHPETHDLDHQLEVTNRFLEENPDVDCVILEEKEDH